MTIRFHTPHPVALLVMCVLLAAAATWVLPAGKYDRVSDAATGRDVVVAGTYHRVERQPVGIFQSMVAIPKGMAAAADVIALVFLVGGAFAVIEQTGALRRAARRLARALSGRERLLIPFASIAFAIGGVTENMQEEIIAFIPLLLLLCRSMGFNALIACAISVGAAAVGSAFSPVNPFQVLIAQKVAQLPPASGGSYRLVLLVIALTIWIGLTMRYAANERVAPEALPHDPDEDARSGRLDLILILTAISFILLPVGLNFLGWGFDELSAMFFVLGIVAGLIAGLGLSGTSEAFAIGFRQMAVAALLIGFARTISLVLEDGQVLDTIVVALAAPLELLPRSAAAVAMMGAQALIHVPVPSVSSQAVLTMPVLVPVSDLLHISRQVTVLAYQLGAGLTDLLTPTNGALMAILAAAGVPFGRWIRFAAPIVFALALLGVVGIVVGLRVWS